MHASKHIKFDDSSTNGVTEDEEPRFTFEEVKEMIDRLIEKQAPSRGGSAVSAELKRVNFDDIAVKNHSVQACEELIKKLVHNTRRIRTLQEVLSDIKDNLKKRTYTEIIQRATIKGDLPKRPPTAYLLYHKDRYEQLKGENNLAAEVSKRVAEEWRSLSDKERRKYIKEHAALVRKYEQDMKELGLIDDAAPKRPRSARACYIEDEMSAIDTEGWSPEDIASKRDELGQTFDNMPAFKKQPWLDQHAKSREAYLKEKEVYIAAHPHLDHAVPERKQRMSTKIKPPEPPKSALKYFISKKTPHGLEGQEFEELKTRLKEKFTQLKDKKLLKYIKKAMADKERYDREVEEFKREHPDIPVPNVKTNVSKDQLRLYSKIVENRPDMPAPNAYLFYCGKLMSDMYHDGYDEQTPTARMRSASESWQNLTPSDKRKYEVEHLNDIQRYISEMKAWIASQPDERRMQIYSEEPKANPDYWSRKVKKIGKALGSPKKK